MNRSRVHSKQLTEDRLDANYYSPEFLQNDNVLRSCGLPLSPVGSVTEKCNCGATPVDVAYADQGQGLIRTSDVRPNLFRIENVFRTKSLSVQKSSTVAAVTGDLLYTMSGTVGYAAVIPPIDEVFSFSNTIARARFPKNGNDPHFVAAFFNSTPGYRQSLRLVSGGIQGHVMPNPFKKLLVPLPDRAAQRFIGDKVRQSELLLALSRKLGLEVAGMFKKLTDGLPACPKAYRTESRLLDSFRVNPGHYDPVVLKMLRDAETQITLKELGSLFGDRDLSGGATPLGADYCDTGVFFVRVQNVKPYHLDLSDSAYLTPAQDSQLARSRCAADDIIFSITGYPGTASLVMNDDLPVNINQHCVRFNIRAPYDAAYVVAAMNSHFVKRQVDRLAIGGTREALDYPSVRSLAIPILEDSAMKEVGQRVRTLNTAARLSQRLIVAAKCLVEALIEGTITEKDLIDIQRSLDGNDCRSDRELLARLTPDGIDKSGAPKLFPDLEAFGRLLNDATSEGAI